MKPLQLILRASELSAGEVVLDFTNRNGHHFFSNHRPATPGKARILDAIRFALYGQLPGAPHLGPLCPGDAGGTTPAEVIFDFALGGGQFRVRRAGQDATLWRRSHALRALHASRAQLCEDESTPVAVGWEEVNVTVRQLCDAATFCQIESEIAVVLDGSAADVPGAAEGALRQRRLAAADATRQLALARQSAREAEAAKVKAERKLFAELGREPQREEARALVDRLSAMEARVLLRDQARAQVRTVAEALGRLTIERDAAAASLEKIRRQAESAARDVERLTVMYARLPRLQDAAREAARALKGRERLELEPTTAVRLCEERPVAPASPELAAARERAVEAEAELAMAESAGLELEQRKISLARLEQQRALAADRLEAAEKAATDATARLEATRAAVAERSADIPASVYDLAALDRALSAARRRVKGMDEALEQARQAAREAAAASAAAAAAATAALANAERTASETVGE